VKIQPGVDVEKIEFYRGECKIEHPSASAEHVLAPNGNPNEFQIKRQLIEDELSQPSAAGNPSSPTSTPPHICFIVKGEDGQIVAKLTKNWDKIKVQNDSLLIDLTAHLFEAIFGALKENKQSVSKVQGEVEKLSKTYCDIFRCDRK
jgi:hypothetical protein